jgi:pimeloyl-ACP methyl ester carboxylesterase
LPVNEEELAYFDLLMNHFKHQSDASPLPDTALQKLTAPTVLLMGEHEIIFDPLAAVARAKRLIPGLQSAEVVPGVGHGMSGDAPEMINARIRAFVEGIQPSPTAALPQGGERGERQAV